MEYKELLDECAARAELYNRQEAFWNLTHEQKCISAIMELISRAKSAEARAQTLEKMVKEYQEEIIPGYKELVEKAEKERDDVKKDINNILEIMQKSEVLIQGKLAKQSIVFAYNREKN